MSVDRTIRMDALEIAAFLEGQRTGVLSLARNDDGYGIPVSFTYEEDELAAYLRLGYGPDSLKREYLEAADRVSLVVYDETDDGWKSVILRGEPEVLSENSLESSVVQSVRGLEIPYFRVFDREPADLEFNVVRIDAGDLHGIATG